jgi:S1-C subfamily serine protease
MTGIMARLITHLTVFVLGFSVCAWIVHRLPPYQGAAAAPVAPALAAYTPATTSPRSLPPITERYTVADAVSRVEPAVVNIDTLGKSTGGDGAFEDRWLRRFFNTPRSRRPDSAPRGIASGVIISPEGHVLTNHHVVEDAERIRVTLPDKRRYEGNVLGTDPDADLAIVKINGGSLPVAELGDSARLRKGEWVVAIGNPLGFESTVTVGVVSAARKGSFTVEGKRLHSVIQTDAAINQGNSGGALVNLEGRLVGINTAIVSTPLSGGSIGIGFAIPINDAVPVVRQLLRNGKVLRPWIGIQYEGLRDEQDVFSDPPKDGRRGVVVLGVFPDSPAASAGIRSGDVIRGLDRTRIERTEDVIEFVQRHHPGDSIAVMLLREGKSKTLTLRLVQRPEPAQLNALEPR